MSVSEPRLGSRVLIGAVAGFAATAAMAVIIRRADRRRIGEALGSSAGDVDVPAAVAELAYPDRSVPEEVGAGDFLYGAASGSLLAVANPRIGLLSGAVAGVSAWTGSQRRHKPPVRARLMWGFVTALVMRELLAARTAFLAARNDGDAS
jgi:hypothetical protein